MYWNVQNLAYLFIHREKTETRIGPKFSDKINLPASPRLSARC
jgi:hypothetical protein